MTPPWALARLISIKHCFYQTVPLTTVSGRCVISIVAIGEESVRDEVRGRVPEMGFPTHTSPSACMT